MTTIITNLEFILLGGNKVQVFRGFIYKPQNPSIFYIINEIKAVPYLRAINVIDHRSGPPKPAPKP